jgi:hypothetical protein
MSRIVRLSESNLNKFIKKVVKEQIAMGSDENMSASKSPQGCQKQTSRPFCSKMVTSKTIGGKMIPLEGSVFMMVTDESGCPKLCKVQGEIYKLV